jgi:Tfp pilus assembly protein PilX
LLTADFISKILNSEFRIPKSRGVSLIAAIFMIVILAFMGVMFVSLIGTSSLTSVNDLQSAQALYVAEGGSEFVLKNRAFPNYSMNPNTGGTSQNLGAGSFSVTTPAYLTGAVAIGDTAINVNSTNGFASPSGRVLIDSEVIAYTNIAGNTFNPAGPVTATHLIGNAVYPVTRVANAALANNCTATDVQVDYVNNFITPGIVTIGSEYFYCAGTAAGPTRFTSCSRCYKGSSASAHLVGANVFQYLVASAGTVGNASRTVKIAVRSSGGEAIQNGLFPNGSLGSWPDISCPPNKQEGVTSIDMGTSASADGTGSLSIQTDVGRKKTMDDCRQQILTTAIPPSTPVTLNLNYQFSTINGACGVAATCAFTIDFIYSSGASETVWTNAAFPNVWTATGNIPWVTMAGVNLTSIRVSYSIESANVNDAQATGWIDGISLIAPGSAALLNWQEVVN